MAGNSGHAATSLRGMGLGVTRTQQDANKDFQADDESMQAIMGGTGINDDHLRRATGFSHATSTYRPSYAAPLRRMTSGVGANTTAPKPYVRPPFLLLTQDCLLTFVLFLNLGSGGFSEEGLDLPRRHPGPCLREEATHPQEGTRTPVED